MTFIDMSSIEDDPHSDPCDPWGEDFYTRCLRAFCELSPLNDVDGGFLVNKSAIEECLPIFYDALKSIPIRVKGQPIR